MTVTSTTSRNDYPGTGSAGPFVYGFKIFAYSDLLVTKTDADGVVSTLTYGVDFTATGVQANVGGTITLSTALETGENLTIRRVLPLTQLINLRNQGSTFPQNLENGLDQAVMREQALDNDVRASVRLAETIDPDDFDTSLPANMEPGDAIVVNATGDGFSMGALSAAQLTPWSASHNLVLDRFTSGVGFTPGVSTTLALSANPGSEDNCTVTARVSGTVRVFEHDEYSVSGTTLTFGSVIPAGATYIEVSYMYTYQVNRAAAENVTYSALVGGATNVRDDLRYLDNRVESLMVSVKDTAYGAIGNGIANDLAAIQSAIDDVVAAGGGTVFFPEGEYKITGSLTFGNRITLMGAGRDATTITYTGAAEAITTPNSANRYYNGRILDMSIETTTGTVGLDVQNITLWFFQNLSVDGFDVGIKLSADVTGGCLYNRFIDISVSNCPIGYLLQGAGPANSNSFYGCRATTCVTHGVAIVDTANQNVFRDCQIEGCGNGCFMDGTALSVAGNVLDSCRFEGNTIGVNISDTDCVGNVVMQPYNSTNGTDIVDLGSRTQIYGGPIDGRWQFISNEPRTASKGLFRFVSTNSGGANLPMFLIEEQLTSSGTPVTFDILEGRSTAIVFRVRDVVGAVYTGYWYADGHMDMKLAYYVNGTKVVGPQGALVADASGGATVDAEARTALNALLARCRAHGLIAT